MVPVVLPAATCPRVRALALLLFAIAPAPVAGAALLELPDRLADTRLAAYRQAIETIHRKALRARKPPTEEDLRRQVPAKMLTLESRYERIDDPRKRARALAELALLHAELAWVDRIGPILESLRELDPDLASRVGHFEESEHCIARVVGCDAKWARAAVRLAEAAREGHRKLFGFRSISKVPGKKIRILIHLDASHEGARLYYHPSPPWHSEIRYEIRDEKHLTLAGRQRIVYGFCHEMGHMVAMWGQYRKVEEDFHAWGHYTGCLVVDQVYETLGNEPWPGWTSYQRRASGTARLRSELEGQSPGTGSREEVLALFDRVGDLCGTDAYGRAWEWLDGRRRIRRIQQVRYLWLRDLRDGLIATLPRERAREMAALFGPMKRR